MIVDGDMSPDGLVTASAVETIDLRAPGVSPALYFFHGAESAVAADRLDDLEERHRAWCVGWSRRSPRTGARDVLEAARESWG
jgi:hypothetical protein